MLDVTSKRAAIHRYESELRQSSLDSQAVALRQLTHEFYRGNGDDLVLVGQKQFAVVGTNDTRHLVGTCGLGACVAVVAQSNCAQLGFCTHFDVGTDLEASASALWKIIRSIIPHEELTFKGYLRGGQPGWSEWLIEFCKTLNAPDDIRLEISCNEILGPPSEVGRNIVMDSRDGRLLTFEPSTFLEHWEVFERSSTAKLLGKGVVASCVHVPDRYDTLKSHNSKSH